MKENPANAGKATMKKLFKFHGVGEIKTLVLAGRFSIQWHWPLVQCWKIPTDEQQRLDIERADGSIDESRIVF